jgi:hypothetical protein
MIACWLRPSALAKAERYSHSPEKYQHKWARIYIERGEVALQALALLDEPTGPDPAPRRAVPEIAPKRALVTPMIELCPKSHPNGRW